MKVVISGAGPAALLMANYLMRGNQCQVTMIERRSDPRTVPPMELRTFPITIQSRGMNAITSVDPGLEDALNAVGHPTDGFMMHSGKTPRVMTTLRTLSVDRSQIALTLLEELEKLKAQLGKKKDLDIKFDCKLDSVDVEKKRVTISKEGGKRSERIDFDVLIAADGARSKIREQLGEAGLLEYSQEVVPDDYRTIYYSRTAPDGETLAPNKMHGVMKDGIQLIGIPVHPDCASGAFVFPRDKDPLKGMTTGKQVKEFFEEFSPYFAGKFVTEEEAENLLKRPVSSLVTVKCDRLAVNKCVLLIGDAAHAVSASIGQGLNSALQDVQVFASHLEGCDGDWEKALDSYSEARLPDALAVAELSSNASANTKWMRYEFLFRLIMNKILPTSMKKWMKPLPMQLMSETDLSYSQILEQCQWWVDKVKASKQGATMQKDV